MHYGSPVDASYRSHYLVLFEATARVSPPCRHRLSAGFCDVAAELVYRKMPTQNIGQRFANLNLNASLFLEDNGIRTAPIHQNIGRDCDWKLNERAVITF